MSMDNKMNKYIKYSQLSRFQKDIYYVLIYSFIKRLSWEYPRFREWYNSLFFDDLELKHDREIILCEKDCRIVGIAILKRNTEERKICTLRVDRAYQRQGIGKKLMELSFEWLEDEKPLITLHKNKVNEFAPLFRYYDFKLEQKKWNYYNVFSTELAYNGVLPEKNIYFNKIEIADIQNLYRDFINSGKKNFEDFYETLIMQWARREKIRRLVMNI